MKSTTDLRCELHGNDQFVAEECNPNSPHDFALRCQGCSGRFIGWANKAQVAHLLASQPEMQFLPYGWQASLIAERLAAARQH